MRKAPINSLRNSPLGVIIFLANLYRFVTLSSACADEGSIEVPLFFSLRQAQIDNYVLIKFNFSLKN